MALLSSTQHPSGGGIAAVVAALTGPRRSANRTAGRAGRLGRHRDAGGATPSEDRADAGSAAAPTVRIGGTRRPGPESCAPEPGAGGTPAPERRTGEAGDGAAIGRAGGNRPAESRRAIEAEMIGLGADAPAWWNACWSRGSDADQDPRELFPLLTRMVADVRIVRDLRLTGTDEVIEHVLVGPGGVVVVDTVWCPGRVKSDGVHLRVRGRDRSPIVDVALWRTEVVRAALMRSGLGSAPVHGVVHWRTSADMGNRAICLRGVPLLSAGAAVALAAHGIALSPHAGERIVTLLTSGT